MKHCLKYDQKKFYNMDKDFQKLHLKDTGGKLSWGGRSKLFQG